MVYKRFFSAGIFLTITALLLVFHCELPQDPTDPSNTSVGVILRASDWTESSQSVTDTVGNTIQIGVEINLPGNVDSLRIKITADGVTAGDTVFRNFATDTKVTLWKKIYFTTPGTKAITVTPYSSLDFTPIVAFVNIVPLPGPANIKPLIITNESVVTGSAVPCSLLIRTSDADTAQIRKVSMSGAYPEAVLQGDSLFLWTPPVDFVGYDTVSFVVTDNGKPPFSDTATSIIIVTATPHPPTISVSGNQTIKPLGTCTLTVHTTDLDAGQKIFISMTEFPPNAAIVNDSLFIWTAPATSAGEYKVLFTATDNGTPPLSSTSDIRITVTAASVNAAPKWDAKTLPVPLKDTAKYTKKLTDICHDDDGDAITFTLSSGAPAGDTIIGAIYTFTAKPALVGPYKVKIIASDPKGGTDTLVIDLTVTSSSTVEVTPPTITLVAPPKDSLVVATPTYPIDIIASDASGIASVTATLGATTLPLQPVAGHYTVTMGGLKAGEYNKIELLATDASPAANKLTQTVFIKYSPGFTIKYDGNGNTGGEVPVDTGSYQAGAKVTVKANTGSLIKTGSTFAEWNTSKDGTGTAYAPGATFTMGNANDTLFAKWSSKGGCTLSSLSFVNPAATGTINDVAKSVNVSVPYGTSVTELVAIFVASGESVKIGATIQTSGITPNNFAVPVTYTVNAADGSSQDYLVTVVVDAPQPVSLPVIPGVTAPVTGATPVTTITETAQYTGTVAWTGSPAAFAAATAYTATITLTAKTGFTFSGVGSNFFTVAGATAINTVNTGSVTAVFPATNATVINIPAIPGVTVPITGATPVTTITETAQYTGIVTWSGSPVAFAAATAYTATITLTAKAGFTFSGVAANFFTVAGATATNAANTGNITAVFPATNATVINIPAISGVTAPVTGATPVTIITETAQYTGTVSWSGSPVTFAATTAYTATITLTAKAGFTVSGVAANFFTVNGATATNVANTGSVTAVFPATALAGITIAAIPGVTSPVTGATPATTITETAQYTGTVSWSGSPVTFAATTAYTATITLTAKAGFTFAGVATNFFTVAGATTIANTANAGIVTAMFPATFGADYTSPNIGTLKYVPTGTFQRDATPGNTSTVSAFRMSAHEITRAQFLAIMGTDPSYVTYSSGTSDPVQMVNWYHAIAFCNKLSIAEGLTQVYSVAGVNFATLVYDDIPRASNNAVWDAATVTSSNTGYRLPTEMEWMWAAMGGTSGGSTVSTTGYSKAFAGYTGSNAIGDFAVFGALGSEAGKTPTERTSPAGSKSANELGVYDMSGNVFEWCWDIYYTYPTGAVTDYLGAAIGNNRVARGGSWAHNAFYSSVSMRNFSTQDGLSNCFGIRVVRP